MRRLISILISLIISAIANFFMGYVIHNNFVVLILTIVIWIALYRFIDKQIIESSSALSRRWDNQERLRKVEERENLAKTATFMTYAAWNPSAASLFSKPIRVFLQYGPVTVNPETGKNFDFADYYLQHNPSRDVNCSAEGLREAFNIIANDYFTPIFNSSFCPEYEKYSRLFKRDLFENKEDFTRKFSNFYARRESPFFQRYKPWNEFAANIKDGRYNGEEIEVIYMDSSVRREDIKEIDIDPSVFLYGYYTDNHDMGDSYFNEDN